MGLDGSGSTEIRIREVDGGVTLVCPYAPVLP